MEFLGRLGSDCWGGGGGGGAAVVLLLADWGHLGGTWSRAV